MKEFNLYISPTSNICKSSCFSRDQGYIVDQDMKKENHAESFLTDGSGDMLL